MKNKEIIVLNDLNGKTFKFTVDRSKLSKGILNAIEGISCTQPTFVSKYAKKLKVENKAPSLQDVVLNDKKPSSLRESFYNKKSSDYPTHLNPFHSALSEIKLDRYESLKLNKFLDAVMDAKDVSQLNEVIDRALKFGLRVNACNDRGWSLSDFTAFKMHLDEFSENEQRDIMRKLVLKGGVFNDDYDKKISEIYNELHKGAYTQLNDQLTKLKEVAKGGAIKGTIQDVEFDNRTFYMKFSQDSVVDVEKIVQGTRSLGFDKGNIKSGSDIIKIGKDEVEIKAEEGGKINYLDISNNSSVKITFHTNCGDINVNLFHDQNNHDKVQVRVDNTKSWEEFKTAAVVKNCLLGGIPINKAVEQGNFIRCGKLGRERDLPNEKDTWVNRVLKGSAVTSLER